MNLGFLKMEPEFSCISVFDASEPEYKCTAKDFCDYETNTVESDVGVTVKWDSPFSLHNMVTKFDIYCAPKLTYMLFGTSMQVGHLIFLVWFS